jgi:MFS family permease
VQSAADPTTLAQADRASRNAALALALALPGDVVLYLILPLFSAAFGITLLEAGMLLAANRLVRIVGYRSVANFYATRGARAACIVATVGAVLSTTGYAVLSGFWALLVARLVWGLSFAALNIANQALPTSVLEGAARRSGRARSIVAVGPMVALVVGALLTESYGPRAVFVVLAVVAMLGPIFALRLPAEPEPYRRAPGPRFTMPDPISIWSFCMGLTLDGLFVFGLSLLAAANLTQGAVIAAGAAMALRYASEIALSTPGGVLAQRFGPRRMLVLLSIGTGGALALLGTHGVLLWIGLFSTVILRAMLQPLPGPVVAEAFPGPERVPALATQATWRDLGAGLGPLVAGLAFPILPPLAIYAGAGALLASASLLLAQHRK